MQTSNELLGGILVTLKSIEATSQKTSQKSDSGTGRGGKESGGPGVKTTISSVLSGLGRIKKKDREGYTTFVKDITKIANSSDPKKMEGFNNGLISMANTLPDIAKGLDELGKIKIRKVRRAQNILEGLFNFFLKMGDRTNNRKANRAINTFYKMGKAIQKIAKPLNSMAFFLLKLGISIVGFVGSLLLASMMMGSSDPMTGIGIILGVVLGMVGLMIVLGMAGKWIKKGRKTIVGMGLGLMALALGLVLFVGALLLIPKMLGETPDYGGMAKAALIMGLVILGMVGIFYLMGKVSKAIAKGTAVAFMLAVGLMILAGAAFVVALAAKALTSIADAGTSEKDKKHKLFGMEVSPMVYGLGTMGTIILAGLALFAILGIPVVAGLVALGAAVGIGVAVAMIAMAWSVKELVSISKELQGVDIAKNISTMIGGVLRGFTDGMMIGLIGKSSGNAGVDALNVIAIPAKIALIMTGIVLVSGVAIALSLFALSLRAFEKVGQIVPITGHDKEGKPIYGKGVTVAQVATNIANAIGIFFTTLGDLFDQTGGKSPLPSPEQMDKIVYALMGSGGFTMFGVPIARSGPNLMDALYQFGEVLQFWGKFGAEGRISMGSDAEGKPIQGPKLGTVAKNIAQAVGTFMRGLSTEILTLDDKLAEKTLMVSYILLGKKNTGALGWLGNALGLTRDRPGILEPVSKFGEIIQQFASGQYIKGYDKEGTPIYGKIDYKKTADNIVKGIQHFTKSLADGLTKADSSGYDYGKAASSAGEFLEDFEDLFVGLEKLSNAQSGLDKLADSLNSVGQGIGLIAENVGILDADKFNQIASTAASYQQQTEGLTPPSERGANASGGRTGSSSQDAPDWDNISSMIGQQVGQQVSAALSSSQFKFEFQSPTGGIMTLEQD